VNYLSFDIMTDVVFSVKRHLVENPEYRWITSCIENTMHRVGVISQIPWAIWWGIGLHWFVVPSGVLAVLRFSGEVLSFVSERTSRPPSDGRKDVYQNLLNAKDPDTGGALSTREVRSESAILIVAGTFSDPTIYVQRQC
jgi:hypothetical protein